MQKVANSLCWQRVNYTDIRRYTQLYADALNSLKRWNLSLFLSFLGKIYTIK